MQFKINVDCFCLQSENNINFDFWIICNTIFFDCVRDGRWEFQDGRWEFQDDRWEFQDGRWEFQDGRWDNRLDDLDLKLYVAQMQAPETVNCRALSERDGTLIDESSSAEALSYAEQASFLPQQLGK